MARRFEGKIVAIIGGATGIGAATVLRLAKEGANVILGDPNRAAMDILKAQVEAFGCAIHVMDVDQSNVESMRSMMAAAKDGYGGIDCLFLNGADTSTETQTADTDVVAIDLALWDHIIATNLRGYMLGLRFSIPLLLERGGGSIVCTSSESSFIQPDGFRPAYGVSKAGVNALVRHVATRFGRQGVRCNAIAPGMIQTDTVRTLITPEKLDYYGRTVCSPSLGLPENVAAQVAHLLSDDGTYINGQTISVNGGSLLR